MAPTIEADSLSDLTSLASDPPLDPNLPVTREPLVLYIARVPGSRGTTRLIRFKASSLTLLDVFLTPLKPREKVVTAEDVQSSLYYLHVHGPTDERLLEGSLSDDLESETGADVSPEPSPRPEFPPLKRKPLPPTSIAAADNPSTRLQPPGLGEFESVDEGAFDFRPPYRSRPGLSVLTSRDNIDNTHNVAAGRYDGSRSPPAATLNGRNSSPSIRNLEQLVRKSRENQRHLESLLDGLETDANAGAQRPRPAQCRPNVSKRSSTDNSQCRNAGNEVNLTLIRRDRSSGQQWNVATILDLPVFDVSSENHHTKKSGQPMYLSITNPGYSKFDRRSTGPCSSLDSSTSSRRSSSSDGTPIFQRRIWMEGSIFGSSKSFPGHRKSLSADHFTDSRRTDSLTADSLAADSRNRDPVMHTISVDDTKRRSKTRGYTFLSPWKGRCEFSASTVGHSLKCKHSFLSPYLSVDGHNTPTQVSELRFNLPGGGPLATTTPSSDPTGAVRLQKSGLLRPRGRSEAEISAYAGEEDRLDLRLGQERAGGGFAGKQAKLGKLILEGEGLKMMDLLVAANMAIWWRAWEKA